MRYYYALLEDLSGQMTGWHYRSSSSRADSIRRHREIGRKAHICSKGAFEQALNGAREIGRRAAEARKQQQGFMQ
jgi:hypothetical protein